MARGVLWGLSGNLRPERDGWVLRERLSYEVRARPGSLKLRHSRRGGLKRVAGRQRGMIVTGLGRIAIFKVICGELACLARVHDPGIYWGGSTRQQGGADTTIQEAEELCG